MFKFLVIGLLASLGAGPLTSGSLTGGDRPQPQDWPRPLADQGPPPKEWPCPSADVILPCVCTVDDEFDIYIDCSAVETCEELQNAFDASFPFTHFKELRIDHDPSDWHGVLTTLGTNTFGEVTFERVIIRGTLISSLHPQTFAYSLTTLTYLNLANNKLNDFPFETLPLYTVLRTLILEENYLLSLPHVESASLEIFSVSGNRKMTFNETVFLTAPSLQEVYMARLLLPNLLPGFFINLENLTMIDLEENSLTGLDEFTIATHGQSLSVVNLNDNQISYLHPDAFKGLASSAKLTMTSNMVKRLDEESWSNVFNQVLPFGVIDLADNPLTCGCDMAWIILQANDMYRPLITNTTTCNSGETVIHLDPANFCNHCPSYNCIFAFL